MITYIYPIIILNVDICSFLVNKVFNYFDTGTFSCQVQWSHLMERRKSKIEPEINQIPY